MPSASKFWDRIAERYARQPIADEAAYQKKLQLTREHFTPDMRVFEFGCGTGSTALALAPHVAHIHAIDISPKMLDIARQKAAANHIDNVTFELASIDALDATEPRFNAVMGHSILHLLDNKDETIAKVYRLLTPGGVFVSSTMCIADSFKMRMIKAVVSVGALFGLLPQLRAFTQKALLNSFTTAGFEIAHQWQPKPNSAVFIIARKPAGPTRP